METMTRAGLLSAGRAFTNDGKVHEHRGLKGRNKGRPDIDARARQPARRVPIPPELVALLREHIARSGPGPGGRLFRSENGNPIQPSTWWHVWQKTPPCCIGLTTPAAEIWPMALQSSGDSVSLDINGAATTAADQIARLIRRPGQKVILEIWAPSPMMSGYHITNLQQTTDLF